MLGQCLSKTAPATTIIVIFEDKMNTIEFILLDSASWCAVSRTLARNPNPDPCKVHGSAGCFVMKALTVLTTLIALIAFIALGI